MFSPGIVSDEIDRDPRRAIEVGASLGITRFELRFFNSGRVPDVNTVELEGTLEACARHRAQITSLSPGIFKYARTLAEARAELRHRFVRSAKLAKRLGLQNLIVFGPAKPMAGDHDGPMHPSDDPPEWVLHAFDALADAARAHSVRAMIEPAPLSYTDTAPATASLLSRVGRDELWVNYDPGNIAWAQGHDPRDGVELLGARIANVHVKNLLDAPPDRQPAWSPADRGIVDYAHQFSELNRIGYSGPITLEPHLDGSLESIRQALTGVQYEAGRAVAVSQRAS